MSVYAVGAAQEPVQPRFVGRGEHDHACTLAGRKEAVVLVIVVERDERASKLSREAIVLDVAGAAQIVMFQHEQDVPSERGPHVNDGAIGHVRVRVDTRLLRPYRERREFRRKSSQSITWLQMNAVALNDDGRPPRVPR